MNKIVLAALAVTFLACKTETKEERPIDYAVFSGTITNADDDMLKITGNGLEEEINLNEDGTFRDTLTIDESGYYTFRLGRERSSMYLTQGSDIALTMDASKFDESIKYTGEGAAENNYLASKAIMVESAMNNMEEMFSLEPEAFEAKLVALKGDLQKKLNEGTNLNEDFKKQQEIDAKYIHLVNLEKYPRYNAYFTKKETPVAPENFKSQLEAVNYDDNTAAEASGYYRELIVNNFMDKLYNEADEETSIAEKGVAMLKKKNSQKVKDVLAKQLAYELRPGNDDAEMLYTNLTEASSDEKFKNDLSEKYNKIKNLVKGKPSPSFAYENYKGGTTKLEDLKGKYVYVDVWATWCGPCKAEIPFLKEVEKKYHDKNIAFVSISIDQEKDKETWKKMIEDQELGGIQLFAEADWKSKFATDYAIEGIPRFIIIDPQGNIVSADAPRPSDPKLTEMFDSFQI